MPALRFIFRCARRVLLAVSVTLCLLLTILWLRSYTITDHFMWGQSGPFVFLDVSRGQALLNWDIFKHEPQHPIPWRNFSHYTTVPQNLETVDCTLIEYEGGQRDIVIPATAQFAGFGYHSGESSIQTTRRLLLSFWLFALATAIPPACFLWQFLRRQRPTRGFPVELSPRAADSTLGARQTSK